MKTYGFEVRHGIIYGHCNDSEWWNVIVDGDVVESVITSEGDALQVLAGALAKWCDLKADFESEIAKKAFKYYMSDKETTQ